MSRMRIERVANFFFYLLKRVKTPLMKMCRVEGCDVRLECKKGVLYLPCQVVLGICTL